MRRGCWIVVLIVLAMSLPGCNKEEKKTAEKVINVRVEPALKKKVRPFIEATGTLMPYDKVTVSAEVEGMLSNVAVDEGFDVKKGMLLAGIDDRDMSLEAEKADAALRQAEATLQNTRLEYGRKKSLFEEELITRQQFDDAATRLSIAEAELKRAQSSLSLARQKLSKTKIRSPMSGVVGERKISAGDYVRAGSEMFSIIRVNPLKLEFTVSEKETALLRAGQEASFTVDVYPERKFRGKLKTIYPALEEKTRTLRVEAEVENRGGLLKPGIFAHVVLYTGSEREGVLVPATALLYEGREIKVFVLNGNVADQRRLKTGQNVKLPEGEFVEALEGISEKEQVVTVGQQNLFTGAKVNVAR